MVVKKLSPSGNQNNHSFCRRNDFAIKVKKFSYAYPGQKEGRAPLHALTPKTIPPGSGIYQTPQTNTLL